MFGKPWIVIPRNVEIVVREGAGDGVEARGVDDNVEFIITFAGAQPGFRDAHDRRLADVDQVDVGPVVGLEIARLHRDALYTKAVIPRNELLGDFRILDAPADTVGDVLRKLGVGLLVGENLTEVPEPDAEAGLVVESVP